MQFLWLLLFIPFSVAAQHKQSILVHGGIGYELGSRGQYDYGFGGRVSWQHELTPNFDLGVRFGYGKFNINREKILKQWGYVLNKPSVSVIEDNLFGKSTTWFSLGLNGSVKLNPNQKCRVEIPLEIGLCNVVHSGYSLYGEDYAGWGGGRLVLANLLPTPSHSIRVWVSYSGYLFLRK